MRISDWSSDVCSSDLPVAVTGADRIEQTIPEHRPGKVEAQRIAAVTADGTDPVALDDAVQARRNVTDRFLVRRFDIALADTLHRPRQALRSEERRVGEEGVITRRYRASTAPLKKKKNK